MKHQEKSNDPLQNAEFIFGENNNYHQCGNFYLEFDITVRSPAPNFDKKSEIKLINNPYAHCFKEASLATTGGIEIEHVNFLRQISAIVRALTSKDGDLLSHFDNVNEENTLADFISTHFKQMLIDNHTEAANKGIFKGHLPLKFMFGFCKIFEKITKNLGFHMTLKTNDLQNIFFTTIATDINVTINSLYLFVPVIIPNTDTQVMFYESIKNKYTITYDSWCTERKLSTDSNERQVDIGSAQHANSPKYLIGSF